jgi:GDP-D-mannose dehydratase
VETEVDPELYRPTDAAVALDMTKIRKDCNWLPQYELSETLDAMLSLVGH